MPSPDRSPAPSRPPTSPPLASPAPSVLLLLVNGCVCVLGSWEAGAARRSTLEEPPALEDDACWGCEGMGWAMSTSGSASREASRAGSRGAVESGRVEEEPVMARGSAEGGRGEELGIVGEDMAMLYCGETALTRWRTPLVNTQDWID